MRSQYHSTGVSAQKVGFVPQPAQSKRIDHIHRPHDFRQETPDQIVSSLLTHDARPDEYRVGLFRNELQVFARHCRGLTVTALV
jgi:hypothetical protein